MEKSESKYRKAYKRANCFKGLFTHDIHNMFNSISNALEYAEIMIRNKSFTPKILDYIELVKKQIRRGKQLIKNVRKLSEIEK